MTGPTIATPECKRCGCLACTQEISDCYLSGDPTRDAACRIIGECGVQNKCATLLDCVCGDSQCKPPFGPCFNAASQAMTEANIGIFGIRQCFQEPDCAFYRASRFGECIAKNCAASCLTN